MMTKVKLQQWRRNQIKDAVLHTLGEANIENLPVEMNPILERFGIRITTTAIAKEHGIALEGTEDGYTITRRTPAGLEYLIVYNDTVLPQRARWTIAHELGHIMLDHFQTSVEDQESEANYFARELLAPLAVLDQMNVRTAASISKACDISAESARLREKDFEQRDQYKSRHGDTPHDIAFLKLFRKMFDMEISKELCVA